MNKTFAAITDHLVDAMFLVELDGSIVYANPAAVRLFGELTHLASSEVLSSLTTKTPVVNVPTEMKREGHESLFFLASAAPIITKQGETPYWVVTYHDITTQREEEKRRSYFLSIAGHEIKNPLATVRALAQTVERRERKAGDENTTTAMGKVIGKVDLITHLINDLMDINRLRSEELEYFDEVIELDSFIEATFADFSRMFPQRTVQREGKVEGFLEADRTRLEQVILNLLSNAAKHTPAGEPLTLILNTTRTHLEGRIQDGGPGIPLETREHLFELQYQTPEKHKARPGLGLGLYISRLILDHYGGKIWVEESSEGEGNVFAFSLPRRQT